MDLNVLGCVIENLSEDFDGVTDLPVPGEDFGFGNLPDDEGVVECGRAEVQRSGGADGVGRIGFDNVAHTQVV